MELGRKQRNSYIDNMKAILIFLVVIGHFINSFYYTSGFLKVLYDFIYFFHMHLFIFISSFFSQKIDSSEKAIRRSFYFLKLYIIFQILYTAFNYFVGQHGTEIPYTPQIMSPYWITWYLLAFAIWTLCIPFIKEIKHPFRFIIVMIVAGLLVGFIPDIGSYLAFSRVIVFFSFFLLGYFLPKKQMTYFENSKQTSTKIFFGIIFLVAFILIAVFSSNMETISLYGASSYWSLSSSIWEALLQRGINLVVALLLSLCFLVITTSKHRFYTEIGKNTLHIYLFHGFFVLLTGRFLADFLRSLNDILQVVAVFGLAIGTIVIINLFTKLFRMAGFIK
ncbi:hypothetical protein AZF37_00710 [endosymbiont 'TC1' of Trimyema compressum]|uniref:acyltransferase family protein n=1 Tax=endosymbiont 'TC1' of Trimyema compressum TaxID=243899 RepID=UPI0007F13304|nr:acyltransferase family protein [endosymbiont 'TC1' of Trimyema compressum]AMP19892.1 hypothetical protein AZF37_00710 [endosymbiont 'TC1' of Trimyema compressum]